MRKELGVPADCEIVAPLIFGYPTKGDGAKVVIPKREPKVLKWIRTQEEHELRNS